MEATDTTKCFECKKELGDTNRIPWYNDSLCLTCYVRYELDEQITEIEKAKSRVRIEHDNLKHDYLNGQWRQHGMTRRQCEDRLSKRTGEILGFETALSVLYKRVSVLDWRTDNG